MDDKCIMPNCPNRKDQGCFIGDECMPCNRKRTELWNESVMLQKRLVEISKDLQAHSGIVQNLGPASEGDLHYNFLHVRNLSDEIGKVQAKVSYWGVKVRNYHKTL